MGTSFRPYAPDQSLLLAPSLHDWLPEEHLAYFISETVDALDLSSFYERYEGDGRRKRPFEPRMMVKILVYGYSTGTFSSRKLAKKLYEDVAFRVLAAGNFPAHRTISDFRHQHLNDFNNLFAQVVQVAQEAGVVKLGAIAIDGSKVRANASKHKAMSYGRMKEAEQRLLEEIQELTDRAAQVDAAEDGLYGPDCRGDELPSELQRREKRLEKIQEAKKRLEERQAEADRSRGRSPEDGRRSGKRGRPYKRDFGVPEEKAQENFTDPESRIMKTASGFEQSYNAQIAVDEDSQLIVGTGVSQNGSDSEELIPLVETTQSVTGRSPDQVLADAGYKSEENFATLEQEDIEAFVSLAREGKTPKSPPGKKHPATQRMAARLASETGRQRYRRRKAIVEPVFGWVKEALGFRRFSVRGLEKVTGEWDLVCLAVNLKRLNGKMSVVGA